MQRNPTLELPAASAATTPERAPKRARVTVGSPGPPVRSMPALAREPPSPGAGGSRDGDAASSESAATLRLLQALLAAGRTVEDAVSEALSHLPRLRGPVLAALRASPELRTDLPALAELVEAIADCVAMDGRPRLDLSLTGFADVAMLIARARNIVVLSGAGVSVSCGIPDFRSKGGLYEVVLERFGLHDPQAIFDLAEFKLDPTLFYSFAKDVMPSKDLRPSPTHRFIAELARRGKLRRNYSQNIDGLEARAGVPADRLVLCHGSFLTATCMRPTCRAQVPGDDIAPQVAAGEIPHCRVCNNDDPSAPNSDSDSDAEELDHACARGVLKPDITFFGEYLPERVNDCLNEDLHFADLLLVLGTSLQVAPVARIPQFFPPHLPRLLVNRELVDYRFDVELLGNCDAVIGRIRHELGWDRAPGVRVVAQTSGSSDGPVASPTEGTTGQGEDADDYTFVPPRRFLFAGTTVSPDEPTQDELGLGSGLVAMLNRLDADGSSSSGEEKGKDMADEADGDKVGDTAKGTS